MYFFNFTDFQIIGASPEILVRLRNNKVTIRPIAGTRPRGKNKRLDAYYKKDLLKEFQNTVVSCKDVEFTLFGLSLATINIIISFILSVIIFKLFLNYGKNR